MGRLLRNSTCVALALGCLPLLPGGPTPCGAAPSDSEETLFESGGLRIYRATSRQGRPVMILTNVDQDGNPLPGRIPDAPERSPARAPVETEPDRPPVRGAEVPPKPEPRTSSNVKVVVHHGADQDAIDERDVEIQSDDRSGTTVIININPPAPPEREPLIVPAVSVPVVSYGGLVGPFHYPDRQPFLGYGLGNNSPVWFGGLGLSATERYARVGDRPCTSATDCGKGSGTSSP